jgi:beta-phosphoglucomutase-like phosphatase (HAD superfamily)
MEVPVLLVEFEGVLANTAAMRFAALTEALAPDGIALSAELRALTYGRTTEEAIGLIRAAVGANDDPTAIELARLRAERAFAERAGKGLSLQPGVKQALERLATVGRLALVTRASRREVEFVLDLARLEGLFRPVIGLEDISPPKPDAAPYYGALARVRELFPGQTLRGLAVEDSAVGARAARAAGLLSVIIGDVPPHEAMEADAWFESLSDLTPERVRALIGISTEGAR